MVTSLMSTLNETIKSSPTVALLSGKKKWAKGVTAAAKYSVDQRWYRAKIVEELPEQRVEVTHSHNKLIWLPLQ